MFSVLKLHAFLLLHRFELGCNSGGQTFALLGEWLCCNLPNFGWVKVHRYNFIRLKGSIHNTNVQTINKQ